MIQKKKEKKTENEVITKKFLLEAFDGFAKKYDLDNMVKKSDLVHLEVKIDSLDLKIEHVKSDLEDFKNEMYSFKDETRRNFYDISDSIRFIGSMWDNHEKRIEKLEMAR